MQATPYFRVSLESVHLIPLNELDIIWYIPGIIDIILVLS